MFVNKYFTFEPQQAFLLRLTVLAHQTTGKVQPQGHSVKPSQSVQCCKSFFVCHSSLLFNRYVGVIAESAASCKISADKII